MKYCSHFPQIENCEYGDYCSFAHNHYEIKIERLHFYSQNDYFNMFKFKTELCPFTPT